MIEQISVGFKILELGLESGKIIRNASRGWISKAPYRIVSSLTTIEFIWARDVQTSYYVQDRTIYFRREAPLPPFLYGTEGTDTIDRLIVDSISLPFRQAPQKPARLGTLVRPDAEILYPPGSFVRSVLLAHSINGYPSTDESTESEVSEWVDKTSLVIIFPPEKEPRNVQVLSEVLGKPGTLKPEKKKAYETRLTTQGRSAIVRECTNPPLGTRHKIAWSW
jgi:hypothetical protein